MNFFKRDNDNHPVCENPRYRVVVGGEGEWEELTQEGLNQVRGGLSSNSKVGTSVGAGKAGIDGSGRRLDGNAVVAGDINSGVLGGLLGKG